MEDKTILEALKLAAHKEQDARKFYLESAERVKDACGREMFLSLADEEQHHLTMVQRQYESLVGGGGWVEFAEAAAVAEFEPLKARTNLKQAVGETTSEMDALLLAIQLENDSYDLYVQQAERVASPAGKQMYRYLAQAERRHFDILMLNYEHMITTGGFLGLAAKSCD
ncbi:MAG: ferritin family protein [Chloroflexi bacterium]|nr:ferritin family protein [Chloroflexota bacterium]